MRKEDLPHKVAPFPNAHDIGITSRDPRLRVKNERLTPTEDLNEVQIGHLDHQVKNIDTSFSKEEEHELVYQLIRNINLFSWPPSDMSDIDTIVVYRRLAANPSMSLVSKIKRKVGEEKRATINEEVNKLVSIDFITKVKLPLN